MNISSRDATIQSIKCAIRNNYIARTSDKPSTNPSGYCAAASAYRVQWRDEKANRAASKQSEKFTTNGRKFAPPERSEICTTIKEFKEIQKDLRQQQKFQSDVVVNIDLVDNLIRTGLSRRAAEHLAAKHPADVILKQIEYLPLRNPTVNRLGLLRKSIEENYAPPVWASDVDDVVKRPGADFARHFYAEIGGNSGEPFARPTARDAKDAELLLEQLPPSWSRDNDAARLGRRFAKFVMASHRLSEPYAATCQTAIRKHGEAFCTMVRNEHTELHRQQRNRLIQQQRPRLELKWLEYVRSRELELQQSHPDRYAQFLEERQRERAQTQAMPPGLIRDRALEAFDDEDVRLPALQEFFKNLILDFDSWSQKAVTPEVHGMNTACFS
ncbi:MAG: hypothetical protein IT366_09025 [Candidatus Hydrogenedentes bacterium]|nr:hypothetical protein [Candidatus Hydrogenedentota bacterium]